MDRMDRSPRLQHSTSLFLAVLLVVPSAVLAWELLGDQQPNGTVVLMTAALTVSILLLLLHRERQARRQP